MFFVLNQLFITRYMQPEGLWQRLCRCPLPGNGGVLYKETLFRPRTSLRGYSEVSLCSCSPYSALHKEREKG